MIIYLRKLNFQSKIKLYSFLPSIMKAEVRSRLIDLLVSYSSPHSSCLFFSSTCLHNNWNCSLRYIKKYWINNLPISFKVGDVIYIESNSGAVKRQVSMAVTRVRGISRSVSARRWEGVGFDVRPKPRPGCKR